MSDSVTNQRDHDESKNQLARDIQDWDEQPEHRTGTVGDRTTSLAIARALEEAGGEPEIQEFPFMRRIPRECFIKSGAEYAEGVPLFDGGETSDTGVEGVFQSLTDAGGIAIGTFTSGGPIGDNRRIAQQRGNENHLGIVAVSILPSPGIALLNADEYMHPFGVPVLQVASEHNDWLEECRKDGAVGQLTVTFSCEETTATNVYTEVSGSEPDLQPLVIMTPKSSWWTCTAERGGGLTIWLECMRHFLTERPKRTVIFTANTGHELGHVGLDYVLAHRADLIKGAVAWLHLGANFAAKNSQIRMQISNESLLNLGNESLSKHNIQLAGVTPPRTRPGGEARNIFDGGGQYISFLGSNSLFHHPADRLANNVDLERTARMRDVVVEIATRIANA